MATKFGNEVARATLLDRLVDEKPDVSTEPKPLRTLDRLELRYSVRRELQRLLNTRAPYPHDVLEKQERTAINYGLPDFSHLSAKSPDDRLLIARFVEKTIEAYEPRMQEVRVEMDEYRPEHKALTARIKTVIVVESIRDPVSFPFVINLKDRDFNLDAV